MIKQLDASAIVRLAEIDRSEKISTHYVYKDGILQKETVDWDVPTWLPGDDEHSIGEMLNHWRPILDSGAILLGAFDSETLAGIAIYRSNLRAKMAQLALLHVSRRYRRQGIAKELTNEMIRLAREDGATEMYVSATPSGSAVGFYTSQGFELAPPERIHPELFSEEPEDIHMIKQL